VTVTRERRIHLPFDLDAVRSATVTALQQRRVYRIVEHYGDDRWVISIRPAAWPLLLSTKLDIELAPFDAESTCLLRTTSQRWVVGDIFGAYNRYLNTLAQRIRNELDN